MNTRGLAGGSRFLSSHFPSPASRLCPPYRAAVFRFFSCRRREPYVSAEVLGLHIAHAIVRVDPLRWAERLLDVLAVPDALQPRRHLAAAVEVAQAGYLCSQIINAVQ